MQNLKSIQDIQKAGNEAVQRLRKQKLSSGHPFMINSKTLPKGQCYLEFPDGHIACFYCSYQKRFSYYPTNYKRRKYKNTAAISSS